MSETSDVPATGRPAAPGPRSGGPLVGAGAAAGAEPPLVLGLVNNASDAAFNRVEQRFRALAELAFPGRVRLQLFRLPGIAPDASLFPRPRPVGSLGDLMRTRLDGLIVTGCEPRAASLQDESFWPGLVALLDWAERGGVPLVLSCLAAHAAVLHRDGIRRVPLARKCFGVFHQALAIGHPLARHLPPRFDVAHSRWNAVDGRDLEAAGYQLLSRSGESGVDMFTAPGATRWLCLQGHPEYESGALLGEYRRDFGRFLAGRLGACPVLPARCVPGAAVAEFAALEARAAARPGGWALPELAALLAQVQVAPRHDGAVPAATVPAATVLRRWLDKDFCARIPAEIALTA